MCKCCQDEGESSQLRKAANVQSKSGSIVESRTSIKTEVVNSSNIVSYWVFTFYFKKVAVFARDSLFNLAENFLTFLTF